jgi:hypothetical protein
MVVASMVMSREQQSRRSVRQPSANPCSQEAQRGLKAPPRRTEDGELEATAPLGVKDCNFLRYEPRHSNVVIEAQRAPYLHDHSTALEKRRNNESYREQCSTAEGAESMIAAPAALFIAFLTLTGKPLPPPHGAASP